MKNKFTTERTETTEKSTSARASEDCKVTVPRLLTHRLCLHLFSVTPVVPQARDGILLGLRPRATLYYVNAYGIQSRTSDIGSLNRCC
jgi:hypothetical protein